MRPPNWLSARAFQVSSPTSKGLIYLKSPQKPVRGHSYTLHLVAELTLFSMVHSAGENHAPLKVQVVSPGLQVAAARSIFHLLVFGFECALSPDLYLCCLSSLSE